MAEAEGEFRNWRGRTGGLLTRSYEAFGEVLGCRLLREQAQGHAFNINKASELARIVTCAEFGLVNP